MKKINNSFLQSLLTVLCATFALSLASCVKTPDEIAPTSDMITFGAAAGYENILQTRTEYSRLDENGVLINSSSQFERIDWVAGSDRVRVLCAQALDQSGAPNTAGTWVVGTPSADGKNSSADVTVADGTNPFYWGEGTHYFYALYPAAGTVSQYDDTAVVTEADSKIEALAGGKAKITGSIPAAQGCVKVDSVYKPNMNFAYMYEAKKTARTGDNSITLEFKPLVTAFEFSLKAIDDAMAAADLQSVKLSSTSTDLTGGFTATLDVDGDTPVDYVKTGTSGREITVTMPTGTRLSKTQYSVVTFLALGVDQTDLKLTLNFAGGTSRSLDLVKTNDTPVTVDACKKAYFKFAAIETGEWIYTLEETTPGAGMHLRSAGTGSKTKGIRTYKTHVGNGGGYTDGEQVVVPVNYRYSLADEDGNNLNDWSDGLPAWLTDMATAYQTSVGGEPEDTTKLTGSFAALPLQDTITINRIQDHVIALKAKGTNGATSLSPQDLSLYDITNLTATRSGGKPKTANAYVIDRPGWYMFPLVYGNAIDWEMGSATTGWNTLAYTDGISGWTPWSDNPTSLSDGWVLHTFRNYLDNDIDTPYIIDNVGGSASDYNAVVVWEDKPCLSLSVWHPFTGGVYNYNEGHVYPDSFIEGVAIVDNPTTSAVFKNANGTNKTVPYIKFKVDADNIREGNAVIALRDSENRIVWSWHIWISDQAMTTTNLESRSTVVPSNDMLDKPLGHTDDMVQQTFYYSDRNAAGTDIPRVCYVEVTHAEAESTCAPLVFQVTHSADTIIIRTRHAVNYYQYGRKDSFLGTTAYMLGLIEQGDTTWLRSNTFLAPKTVVSQAGYTIIGGRYPNDLSMMDVSDFGKVSYGIQNPYKAINCDPNQGTLGNTQCGGWTGTVNRNLWNRQETAETAVPEQGGEPRRDFFADKDLKVVKTVYDPCPPGFSVPNYGVFTLFSTDGSSGSPLYGDTVDIDEEGLTGILHYADHAKTRRIAVLNTNFRQYGGMGQCANGAYFLTSKSRGQLYCCMYETYYYNPAGPISDMARYQPTPVMAAKEIQ